MAVVVDRESDSGPECDDYSGRSDTASNHDNDDAASTTSSVTSTTCVALERDAAFGMRSDHGQPGLDTKPVFSVQSTVAGHCGRRVRVVPGEELRHQVASWQPPLNLFPQQWAAEQERLRAAAEAAKAAEQQRVMDRIARQREDRAVGNPLRQPESLCSDTNSPGALSFDEIM